MPPDSPSELAAVRRLLGLLLPAPASLQAFCARHFPAVAPDSAGAEGWDRLVERLLSRATAAQVRFRLAIEHPEVVAQHTDYPLQVGPPAGMPSSLCSLPQPRDPHFTGRAEQLGMLRGLLSRHREVWVVGPAGVGKTALAIELSYRLAAQYQVVYGLNAATAVSLRSGLSTLARRLAACGLVTLPTDADAERACAVARDYLNRSADWLLIVDDVRDPHAVTTLLSPSAASGQVLLTSAEPVSAGAHATGAPAVLALGPLAEAESLQLLARRSDRHKLVPGERAAVHRLARALGYWPAALCSVADTLRLRGGTWIEALDQVPAPVRGHDRGALL
jgi:hypothetical protein